MFAYNNIIYIYILLTLSSLFLLIDLDCDTPIKMIIYKASYLNIICNFLIFINILLLIIIIYIIYFLIILN